MLLEQINADLKTSMKSRDADRTSVLRMILSDLKNERISKGGDLDEDEAIKVLKRGIKTRLESAGTYADAGRSDLAQKEQSEAELLQAYLPEQITGEALESVVKDAVAKTGASSIKDMGAVMKAVMAEKGSAVDGKELSTLVKKLLA